MIIRGEEDGTWKRLVVGDVYYRGDLVEEATYLCLLHEAILLPTNR